MYWQILIWDEILLFKQWIATNNISSFHWKIPHKSLLIFRQLQHWHFLFECFPKDNWRNVLKNSRLQKAYLCQTKSGGRLLMCTLHSLAVSLDRGAQLYITFLYITLHYITLHYIGWGDTTLQTSLYNAMSMRSVFLKYFQSKLFCWAWKWCSFI